MCKLEMCEGEKFFESQQIPNVTSGAENIYLNLRPVLPVFECHQIPCVTSRFRKVLCCLLMRFHFSHTQQVHIKFQASCLDWMYSFLSNVEK